MRIFSLATKEDINVYISTLFLFMIPIFLMLLIPYFLYTSAFIDGIAYIFHFIKNFPVLLQWLIFTVVPGLTISFFLFRGPKTIFIDEGTIEIEYKSGGREKFQTADIERFIAYKTTTPWTWGDLSKEVNYSSLIPIAIKKVNNEKISLFMKGEIWNALKANSPDKPVMQMSVFNRYSFFIALIALLNLINGIAYVFVMIGNRHVG